MQSSIGLDISDSIFQDHVTVLTQRGPLPRSKAKSKGLTRSLEDRPPCPKCGKRMMPARITLGSTWATTYIRSGSLDKALEWPRSYYAAALPITSVLNQVK